LTKVASQPGAKWREPSANVAERVQHGSAQVEARAAGSAMPAQRNLPQRSARALLSQLAKRIFKPRPTITVSQWADAYRELPTEGAAEPGRWQTARTPYLREVMDAYNDPAVTQISLMFAAQLGKTEAILNMIFYTIDVLSKSCMFMWPTEDDVRKFNIKRLKPAVNACKQVNQHLVKTDPITTEGIRFKGGFVDYAMAQTARTQKGMPRGRLFCDEIDEYDDPGAVGRLRNRSKTFPGRKLVVSSTPTDEKVGIHAEFLSGDQRRYFVPCPHKACRHMQVLRFSQLKWEGGSAAREDDVRFNTWYECEACQRRIPEHEKPGMIAAGEWRATREGLAEKAISSHRSYQLSELYSPFPESTWGDIAAEFVKHKGLPPAEFYTERLGEPYTAKGKRIEAHALRILCTREADGGYLKREIPLDVKVLLAAVDVQINRFYYVCRGFGAAGEKSWLIDHQEIFCKQSTPVAELEQFIRSVKYEQKRVNGTGQMVVVPWRPCVWAVDTGDQTRDLYAMVSKFAPSNPKMPGVPKVFAIKGSSNASMAMPYDCKVHDQMRDGTKLVMGVHLMTVNGPHYKEAIHNEFKSDPRLGLLKSEAGDAIGLTRSFLPGDTGDDYLQHMTSEEYRPSSDKANGGWGKWGWFKKPGTLGMRNDFWDCEQYLRALADRCHVSILRSTSTGFTLLRGNEAPNAATGSNNFATKTPPKISIKH